MTTTNTGYSNQELEDVRNMARDLWDLEFQADANEDNPEFDEVRDTVYTYDIAFAVSKLAMLEFVDFDTLPEHTLDEIVIAWNRVNDEGFF